MPQILRNFLSIIAGILLGSVVNMSLVLASGYVIPLPPGVDVSTLEGLKAAMPLFEPKHFLFPFLAHAGGTFFGAFVAVKLSGIASVRNALVVAALFLAGGVQMVMEVPSPVWFTVVDLSVAYLPMAYFGYRLASRGTPMQST